MEQLLDTISATVSTDCSCEDYNEETDEYTPSDYCLGDCYELQKDDVFYVLGEWYRLNEIEEDDFILVKGRGIGWQNLEGTAKTNTLDLDGVLSINGDFTISWTLDIETKQLRARRTSHDEPMGAYFEFDFVHTLPCNNCGDLISKDIHEEELGMCIECSNVYFTHNDEEEVEL